MLHAHLRNKAHDKRAQSARARKYYNEYQVRARGKQLKRRTKEEMVSFFLGGFYYQMCLCYCPSRKHDLFLANFFDRVHLLE